MTDIKILKENARTQAATLGHRLGRFNVHEVGKPRREAYCELCGDMAIVIPGREFGEVLGAATRTPCKKKEAA